MSAAWLEAVKTAYPDLTNTIPEADGIDQWDDAYWSRDLEEGQSLLEAQADTAINLYDGMARAKLEIPAALRAFAPTAKMISKAWGKRSDLDEGDEDDVKEILKVDKVRAQLAAAYTVSAKPERRPWSGPTQAPQPAPAPVAKPKLERFWLYDQAFEMGLTAREFQIYAYLARRAGKSGICWPSIVSIVDACHVDRKTVRRAVKRLRQLRMVAWKRGSFGRSSKYRLTEPTLWKTITGPPSGPVTEGSDEASAS
jgi:hypothetical protein